MHQQSEITTPADIDSIANKERYRVLFLESSGGPGGSSSFLSYMFTYLDRSRLNPLLAIFFPNNTAALDHIRELGIPVRFVLNKAPGEPQLFRWFEKTALYHIWPLRIATKVFRRAYRSVRNLLVDALLAGHLYRILKRERTELLVLNQDICFHISGVIAAKLARVPCICRKAGGIGQGGWAKRFAIPWVDLFIAVSEATASDQRKHKLTKRLELIHEGVDLKRFSHLNYDPGTAATLGVPPGKKVIAAIARLHAGKGQRELIIAAKSVLQHYPEAVFLIVGADAGDGLRNRLQALADELQIQENVIFTGWRDDTERILAMTDIFVHCPTTWIEGLSIACLEAAAMGKPIVGSYNGGIPDVVIDGVTGLLVQPGDVEATAAAILKLLQHEDLALRLGRNSLCRAQREFDMAVRLKELEVLFFEYAATGRERQRTIPAGEQVSGRAE